MNRLEAIQNICKDIEVKIEARVKKYLEFEKYVIKTDTTTDMTDISHWDGADFIKWIKQDSGTRRKIVKI